MQNNKKAKKQYKIIKPLSILLAISIKHYYIKLFAISCDTNYDRCIKFIKLNSHLCVCFFSYVS